MMYPLTQPECDGLEPLERVVIITGNYGSGKTEVAVNWALHLAACGHRDLSIADLDVVNPYFRCREATEELEAHGVRVVVPRGEHLHSELPIILPEIRGMILRGDGLAMLDVGGDDVGARVLRSFAGSFRSREMLQVVNAYRPFTDTVDGCLRIGDAIEASSGLAMTGVVSNAHLMDETDLNVLVRGAELAARVAERRGVGLRFVTAMRPWAAALAERVGVPVLALERRMAPPWKRPPAAVGRQLFRLS